MHKLESLGPDSFMLKLSLKSLKPLINRLRFHAQVGPSNLQALNPNPCASTPPPEITQK